jgi:flagellar protein FliO/FliZ
LTPELGMASLKMIGSLMVVLGLILGLFYALKRLRLRPFQGGPSRQMRLIATLNLAPKRALSLVELNGQWLVIGVGAESVRLITRMDRPAETEALASADAGNGRGFQALLQQCIPRRHGTPWTPKEKADES